MCNSFEKYDKLLKKVNKLQNVAGCDLDDLIIMFECGFTLIPRCVSCINEEIMENYPKWNDL